MQRKSGKLIINKSGKLILTCEIFDEHGSFDFEAFVDTGSSLGLVITKELADAVCAKIDSEINDISIGGGTNKVNGQIRVANFRFGDLVVNNYKATVINGNRNLIGIKFLQDIKCLMIVDFKYGTQGSLISNDRKFAKTVGKVIHCLNVHGNDLTKSNEPCPTCGMRGE